MKEATGELNMTVITLVAIAAIGAVFYFIVWPMVQSALVSQTCKTTYGPGWVAHRVSDTADTGNGNNSQARVAEWECCPDNDAQATDCVPVNDAEGE